jgi:uncharacterized membrane protein YccC
MSEQMSATARDSAAVFQTLVKFQGAMLIIAALVFVFFDARSLGKILALAVLFTVFSIVAFVHLQRRYRSGVLRTNSVVLANAGLRTLRGAERHTDSQDGFPRTRE